VALQGQRTADGSVTINAEGRHRLNPHASLHPQRHRTVGKAVRANALWLALRRALCPPSVGVSAITLCPNLHIFWVDGHESSLNHSSRGMPPISEQASSITPWCSSASASSGRC
jgi:hypothetical protein